MEMIDHLDSSYKRKLALRLIPLYLYGGFLTAIIGKNSGH